MEYTHPGCIVAITPDPEQHDCVEHALGDSGCNVCYADTVRDALRLIRKSRVSAVVCQHELPGGATWRDLMSQLRNVPDPPAAIVLSRLADWDLWRQVVSAGAYDLLPSPPDPEEMRRVVRLAAGEAARERADKAFAAR